MEFQLGWDVPSRKRSPGGIGECLLLELPSAPFAAITKMGNFLGFEDISEHAPACALWNSILCQSFLPEAGPSSHANPSSWLSEFLIQQRPPGHWNSQPNASSWPMEFPTQCPPGRPLSPKERLHPSTESLGCCSCSYLLSYLPSSPMDSRAWPPHPRAGPPQKNPKIKKREHCRDLSANPLPQNPWAARHCCK